MPISPETLAKNLFSKKRMVEKEKDCLFFTNCAVVIFDGFIVWRGNLNMGRAIPNLILLSIAIGLPVAVIEKEALRGKKKYRVGKFCGPGNWQKSSWDSDCGLDFGLMNEYDETGRKKTKVNGSNSTVTGQTAAHNSAPDIRRPGWKEWLDDEYDGCGFCPM
jgi:hypothetical protein